MAIKDAPTVDIIEFDEKEAYNHDRPISSLIRTQLLHLHHAEHIVVPPKARTNININEMLTERQASEYIQKVTALLHKHGKAAAKKSKTKKPAKKTSKVSGRNAAVKKAAGGKSKKTKSTAKKPKSRK
jgi:hypothetical protein